MNKKQRYKEKHRINRELAEIRAQHDEMMKHLNTCTSSTRLMFDLVLHQIEKTAKRAGDIGLIALASASMRQTERAMLEELKQLEEEDDAVS